MNKFWKDVAPRIMSLYEPITRGHNSKERWCIPVINDYDKDTAAVCSDLKDHRKIFDFPMKGRL